jgi:hypothetical protein
MSSVAYVGLTTRVAFLWQNVLGTLVVVLVGTAVTALTGRLTGRPS